MSNIKIKHEMIWILLNTFIQISDMFHPNTDVKANLKLLTITELRSILQARTQTFEKGEGVGTNLHVLSDYVALLSILFKTIIISTP